MTTSKQSKILAYITAYNDSVALQACIIALHNQDYPVSHIYIVDNSQVLSQLHSDKNRQITISHHPENIGIAGGIQEAIQWGIDQNYDFIWTFDQDSMPLPNCLEILLRTYYELNQSNYQIGIIAATATIYDKNIIIQGANFNKNTFIGVSPTKEMAYYECDAPITSGSLIALDITKKIPSPFTDLFIDGVDLDYGYRLKKAGFHNIIVSNAIMHHKFGNPKTVNFLNEEIIFQQYSTLRHYYICRNHTHLELQFSQGIHKITCLTKRMKYLVYTIIKIFLYDNKNKKIKIYACLLGTFHGLIGKLEKHSQISIIDQ